MGKKLADEGDEVRIKVIWPDYCQLFFLGGEIFLGVSMPQIWGQHADVAALNTSSFPSNSGRNDAVEVCNRPIPSRHVLQHLPIS